MIIPESNRLGKVQEYYFSIKNQQIAEMNKTGISVINLGIGSPDMKPSDETIQTLYDVAKLDNSHGYQGYRGDKELCEEIAKWYNRTFNVNITAKEVLPLIGSKEGIMHLTMAFVNEGDEVLIANPSYPTYSSVSLLAGAKIRYYSLKEELGWQIDFDELENQDLSKIKIMWVNFPAMPTGAKATDDTFKRLIKLAKKHKFLICNDNPYSLVLNSDYKSILSYEGAMDVAVELNSLSKSHNMAGWRLGWLVGSPEYIDAVVKFKSNMDSGIFLAIQRAAATALRNSDGWHEERNKEYAIRRKYAESIADKLNCKFDKNQSGLFLWAKIPDNEISAESLSDRILQSARVFITPGFIFGSNGERYIRLSLCSKQEKMIEAIERIENALNR